jgi:hypothetical protein
MIARLLASRQQWPSVIFALTLLAFAIIWGAATMLPAQWCEAGESGVVCFRNWVNALGSSLALIVAGLALLISGRRSGEARRRVSTEAAPVLLGERRAVLYDLKAVAWAAREHAAALRDSVEDLLRALAEADTETLARSRSSFAELYRAWPRHDVAIMAVADEARLAGHDAQHVAGRLSGLSTEIAAALAFLTEFAGHPMPESARGAAADIAAQQPALAHLQQTLDAIEPRFELLLRDAETLVSSDATSPRTGWSRPVR